ncbi:MAG: hypothetical protein QM679_02685 [Patulibacter sp.]
MSLTIKARHRRIVATGVVVAGSLLTSATPAFAAKSYVSFDVSVYPADFRWNGIGTLPANASTGSYSAYYSVRPIDGATRPSYRVEQVRGGAVITSGEEGSVSVAAGDVFRVVNAESGATLASSTYSGQPAITSSVVGQTSFAGTNTGGATEISVRLNRRIARNVTGYDYGVGGQQTTSTNAFETVAYGRLTAIGDTTFAGTLPTPIVAGDYITTSQSINSVANDVETSEYFTVTAPVGVVPAKDVVPPATPVVKLGAKGLLVSQVVKNGLTTMTATAEPLKVSQTLTEYVSSKKSKSKTKTSKSKTKATKSAFKTKSSKKKTKTKTPTVVATKNGASTTAGETVVLQLKPGKKGRKFLKKLVKTGGKLTLSTTVTDAAGNATTATQTVKLKKG